jgi:hypothetical protein
MRRYTQAREQWIPTQADARILLDAAGTDNEEGALIDCVIHGFNVHLTIEHGTSGSVRIERVLTPCRVTLGGSVTIQATPIDPAEAAGATLAAVPATAGSNRTCNSIAPATTILRTARAVTALNAAATLTVQGIATALVLGERLKVAGEVEILTGTVLVEHEP